MVWNIFMWKVFCTYLIKSYATKTYGNVDVQIKVFLTSLLFGEDWPHEGPGRFNRDTHWIGGLVDLRLQCNNVRFSIKSLLIGFEVFLPHKC
jgi:hypothetical protein